jgi:outer membrane lipoprotein-sorting protein
MVCVQEFGFQNGLLSAIVLINNLEQTVSVSFDQLDINPSITPKTFELTIDPSFDIIK